MATKTIYYPITGKIVAETDKAILFRDDDTNTENWFPISQLSEIHRSQDGDVINVADWLLRKKGLG